MMRQLPRLSVVKKEIRDLELDKGFSEKVLSLIGDIECYRKLLSGTGFDERYLFLNERDEKQIRLNRAGENPATPSQRRELYIQLQRYNNVYKLTCKYNELDSREASKVIGFLQGKSDNKPGILVGGSDWENREYQEDYDHFTEMGSEAETEEQNDQTAEAQTKNDMLFEQHILDYNLQIQMTIMRLRYAAQQLMDLGIWPEDYENEKKIARGDLDRL